MSVGITRHYEILDTVIAAHGGARPVEQGEGDSVVAVFTRPSDAIAAAIDAQAQLIAELDWLPVRMAVHTGEAILRGDSNYVGPSIIACARIRSNAHGRQILVSDATAALATGRVPLLDLGTVRLKGIATPERVWQVADQRLPQIFPPLLALDNAPNNLPTAITTLIGRHDDLADVMQALHRSRLTTLTGAGGCGKTRLALAAATASIDQYSGGAWWVELASASTDEQVANAVAAALRVPLVGGTDQVAQVANHLRQIGPAVVVLDNAEHVLDAVARLVGLIVTDCPQVTLLVTSREPLGLTGESVWRTPSLDRQEATALFIDRARSARADLVLDADVVSRICKRLDGIPLAIELAAARVRSLPLERIASELSNVFRVLTGGARTAVARQQTLLASIGWSYDLLTDVEQVVLRRLSVFQAPFRLETAEEVVADDVTVDVLDILDTVGHLVDKSLVQFDPSTGRYRMLETLRQYCVDRLRDSRETVATRNRHAEFYGNFALDVGRRMRGLLLPNDLWEELPDLFAALNWAYEASPVDAYRICSMNRQARLAVGYLDEYNEQLEWLVARDGHEAPAQWATAIIHVAQEAITVLGRFDLAMPFASAEEAGDLGDPDAQLWSGYADGFTRLLGDNDPVPMQRALAAAEAAHNATVVITAAAMLALIGAWTGELALARDSTNRCTAVLGSLRQHLSPDTAGSGHAAAVWLAIIEGRLDHAKSLVEPEVSKAAMYLFLSALSISVLAFATGDDDLSNIAQRWADRPAPKIQSGASAVVRVVTARTDENGDDLERSRAWFLELLTVAATSTSQFAVPIVSALLLAGDVAEARATIDAYSARIAEIGNPPLHTATSHLANALIAHAIGDHVASAAAALALVQLATQQGYVLLQVDGLEAVALAATVDASTAATLLGAAAAARERIGYSGRWPYTANAVAAAADSATVGASNSFERGATLSLDEACALVLR